MIDTPEDSTETDEPESWTTFWSLFISSVVLAILGITIGVSSTNRKRSKKHHKHHQHHHDNPHTGHGIHHISEPVHNPIIAYPREVSHGRIVDDYGDSTIGQDDEFNSIERNLIDTSYGREYRSNTIFFTIVLGIATIWIIIID